MASGVSGESAERVVVALRDALAVRDELVEAAELAQHDRRVRLAHAPVVRRAACGSWRGTTLALVAVDARLVGDRVVVGDDHAALAAGHDLGGVEARSAPATPNVPAMLVVERRCRARARRPRRGTRHARRTAAQLVDRGGDETADVHDHEPGGVGTDGGATSSGSNAIVAGSQSTNLGRAPAATTAAAVAKNVFAGTSTSRPSTAEGASPAG